ncbi:hypothetical protein J2X56_001116 [Herbaspirillum sp. 1173]|uniref:hypothetical protein n=1 Tax=Herbaspirillum sp. 1173 TaxID=2817734 RepID=UPI002856955B|nr:hypothetical protein [Herbaspirillum sp. 1173]MDR6739130.1 hypothetical protein [Herbaspirillum sp. 1173]
MFIYLKGMSFKHGGRSSLANTIIDTSSGTSVAQFGRVPDGGDGFALDPTGSRLALGFASSVEIYFIQ